MTIRDGSGARQVLGSVLPQHLRLRVSATAIEQEAKLGVRGRERLGAVTPVRAAEAPDDEIDLVVAQIRRITRTIGLEFSLRVGAVIIHHFYDGDTNAWRIRGPKEASFRRLAQHPELPMSPGFLYRCVAIFELCDRLNAVSRWQHLGASHLRLVLGMPPDAQEKMLAAANSERWTVRALHEHVLQERSSRITQGGRRAAHPISKSLNSIRKCLEAHKTLLAVAGHPSCRDTEDGIRLVEQMQACLEQLETSYVKTRV